MNKQLSALAGFLLTVTFALSQPPQPPKPSGIEERLKHVGEWLDKELQLSNDQKQKMSDVYRDFFNRMDTIIVNSEGAKMPPPPPPPPPPIDKAEMDKLLNERDAKIKMILNEDQYKKFQSIEKQRPHPPVVMPPNDGKAPRHPSPAK